MYLFQIDNEKSSRKEVQSDSTSHRHGLQHDQFIVSKSKKHSRALLLKIKFFNFSVYYLELIKMNTFSALQPACNYFVY